MPIIQKMPKKMATVLMREVRRVGKCFFRRGITEVAEGFLVLCFKFDIIALSQPTFQRWINNALTLWINVEITLTRS